MNDATIFDYAEHQLLHCCFMEPALRPAIASLALPVGSHGLDAGCGPGGVLPLLAETIGPAGRLTGLDLSPPHLAAAGQQLEAHGLQARVALVEADLRQPLRFPDHTFDWAWSANVLWPFYFDNPFQALGELVRVVKPGGLVALLFSAWTRALLLPGYSRLDRLINAASEIYYFGSQEGYDGLGFHHERALSWLARVGLTRLKLSTHCVHYAQPLSQETRRYIQEVLFEAEYRPAVELHATEIGIDEAELRLWCDLTDPASPNYLLDQADYYCVCFEILVTGQVPPNG